MGLKGYINEYKVEIGIILIILMLLSVSIGMGILVDKGYKGVGKEAYREITIKSVYKEEGRKYRKDQIAYTLMIKYTKRVLNMLAVLLGVVIGWFVVAQTRMKQKLRQEGRQRKERVDIERDAKVKNKGILKQIEHT